MVVISSLVTEMQSVVRFGAIVPVLSYLSGRT